MGVLCACLPPATACLLLATIHRLLFVAAIRSYRAGVSIVLISGHARHPLALGSIGQILVLHGHWVNLPQLKLYRAIIARVKRRPLLHHKYGTV
jgi:hypothetical protein